MTKKLLALFMPLLILSACSNSDPNPDPDPEKPVYPATDKDLNPDLNAWEATVKVTFDNTRVSVEGQSDANVNASINGMNVDLALGSEKLIKVVITGTSANGSVRLTGDRKHLIELNNLNLTSTDRPAINDQNSKRMFLVVSGTNTLADGQNYATAAEDRKGCLFAESHIVVCGDGSLEITGNYRHGLVTDGFLYVNPGVTLKIADAKKNAIHVKGSNSANNAYRGVEIAGGTITALTSAPSGKAIKCDGGVVISGGKISLACLGDAAIDPADGTLSSPACIKSDLSVSISDKATVKLDASGTGAKGINADGNITLGGGSLEISLTGAAVAQNGDTSTPKGIIAHRELTVSGGIVSISATGAGSTGIEAEISASFTGGSLTAFGAETGFAAPRASATGGSFIIGGAANSLVEGAQNESFTSVIKGEETKIGKTTFTWPVTLPSASLLHFGI